MYYIPEPPYFLFLASFLASILSGLAFQAVLKNSVKEWSTNRSTRTIAAMKGNQLFVPFLGISLGSCVFLASGVQIFGFPGAIAYVIAVPMTLLIGWLVWSQLGKILVQLETGGSQALDLDSF